MQKIALTFPGQGTQKIGMGKELYDEYSESRAVFQEVDDALSYNLSRLIFNGQEDELRLTKNAQPAIMAVSIAALKALEREYGYAATEFASCMAGHSLGEYSALCAAEAIDLASTAKLLRIRGEAMQEAVPEGVGAMVAIIGTDFNVAQKIAEMASVYGVCQVANDNGAEQFVLSGEAKAISHIKDIAEAFGVKRVIPLQTSAPFHSSLMKPAAKKMHVALQHVTVHVPKVSVIDNTTVSPIQTAEQLKTLLVEQIPGMVRWRETMEYLAVQNLNFILEVGHGNILTSIAKRMLSGGENAISICSKRDIIRFLEELHKNV